MSNGLVRWADVFAIAEEERRVGFVRTLLAPAGVIGNVVCRFEVAPAGPHTLAIDCVLGNKKQVRADRTRADQIKAASFDFGPATIRLPAASKRPVVAGTVVFDQPVRAVTIYRAPGPEGSAGELWVDYEQQVQGAAPEAGPEDPLQGRDCQTLPVEGGIGGPGPLPDPLPDEVPEVEGVGGDAEGETVHQRSMYDRTYGGFGGYSLGDLRPGIEAPLGGYINRLSPVARAIEEQARSTGFGLGRSIRPSSVVRQARALSEGMAAWASLDRLVHEAIVGGAMTGTLAVTSGEFRASASWKDGVVQSASMSKVRPDHEP